MSSSELSKVFSRLHVNPNPGTKLYNLGKEGLVGAKDVIVERTGKLYTNGKNGLSRLQKLRLKYQSLPNPQNGVVSKVQSAGKQINGIYTKGKEGFIQASKTSISKGAELYSVGKNGVQKLVEQLFRKQVASTRSLPRSFRAG